MHFSSLHDLIPILCSTRIYNFIHDLLKNPRIKLIFVKYNIKLDPSYQARREIKSLRMQALWYTKVKMDLR